MLQTRELRTTRRRWGTLQNLTNFEFHCWGSVLSMCLCVCHPWKVQHFLWVSNVAHICIRAKWLARLSHVTSVIETFPAQTTVTHRDKPRLRPPCKIHGPRRCSNSAAAKILAVHQWKRGNVDWMATLRPITWPWRPELHTFAQPKFEFLEFFERVRESQTFDMICRVMILVRFDGCQIKCCHNFAWGASYSG